MLSNANNALLFLIDILLTLYTIVVLLRVLLQATHARFDNPVSQFVWRATAQPVGWLARGIPRWRNIDLPAIVLAVLLCFINLQLQQWLAPLYGHAQPVVVLWWSVLTLLSLLCNLYFFTILIQALMSWISPGQHSPASTILWTLNEPLLAPVRKRLPSIGGLDLSPLVILIGLQVVSRLLELPPVLG